MSNLDDSPEDPLPGIQDPTLDLQKGSAKTPKTQALILDEKYRFIRTLGEGGMGEVILAEQSHPISREVAIKVIRSGKDSAETLARFEAERQSLAVMSHPNIATVFDAGLLSNGLPFFAMEFVDGVPLDDYCDLHRLTIPERIELFTKICEGVSHAHQKGIIHRDLKPGNILVLETDKGAVPKIIDFGLAKATDHEKIGDQSMLTQMGQVLGTIRYLSPEQAGLNSADVDTRADIYSLGVILYELLIGSTPLDAGTIHNTGLLETLQKIRNEDATPLTAKFRVNSETWDKVAHDRQITNQRLKSMIQGDLECIVMKSLDVDRNRRYGSATELANDLRRFLANEPVLARPASTFYRLRKFVERNRGVSAMLVGMIAVIVSAVTVSIWLALWALDEADVAKKAKAESDNSKEAALKEADKAKKAESKSSESRERALAALGKIREFAFEETMKTRNSDADALIDVILDEYEYWSNNKREDKLPFEKTNAFLQLADLRFEQGNVTAGLQYLKAVEKELGNNSTEQYSWARVARLQCKFYERSIELRQIKKPANKNLEEADFDQKSKQLKQHESKLQNCLKALNRFPSTNWMNKRFSRHADYSRKSDGNFIQSNLRIQKTVQRHGIRRIHFGLRYRLKPMQKKGKVAFLTMLSFCFKKHSRQTGWLCTSINTRRVHKKFRNTVATRLVRCTTNRSNK